ncbi:MAG TPA: Holliday junction branch migration protein RuvA [bacterium]|nr:Holliday junction branch migration protein RuvA [bacterium]
MTDPESEANFMYAHLRGKLTEKSPTRLVLDIGGVGYEVNIPLSTYDRLPETGEEIFLYVQAAYREDSVTLYGFAGREEKTLFNLLLGVSGVGPKVALAILSGTTVPGFCNAIIAQDDKVLSAISGVGKKLSQRLITELKDRVASLGDLVAARPGSTINPEAVNALVALGYSRVQAVRAVQAVQGEAKTGDLETLIRRVLKRISSG